MILKRSISRIMIKVGMLRKYKEPNTVVLAAALAAKYYNMDFFFFNLEDVDFKREKIIGKFYIDGIWLKKETEFPDVIDNSPYKSSNKNAYEKLQSIVPFTTRRIGNKIFTYNKIKEDGVYQDLLIPTKKVQSIHDIPEYLNKYQKIIIKPEGGNRGRGICFIENKGESCIIIYNKKEIVTEMDELSSFIEKNNMTNGYILQPYIKSVTKDNLPFDIRIHVRRDINAEWKVAKIYPRIGTSDGITSNISQGGYIGKLDVFLKRNIGNEYLQIKENLYKFATEFPEIFQAGYNFKIDALGIDIGIDENGKMWIFEVNSYPGSTFFELESQILSMGYAKYLAINK